MRRCWWMLPLFALLLAGCRPGAVWSPDSRRLALDTRGHLLTYDRGTGQFRTHARGPQHAVNPAWAPDGRTLCYYQATVKNDEITALSLARLDVEASRSSPLAPASIPRPKQDEGFNINLGGRLDMARLMLGAAFRPDGTAVVYTSFDADQPVLWLVGADGRGARRLSAAGGHAFGPTWSPDGQWIAFFTSPPEPKAPPRPEEGLRANGVNVEVIRADGSGRRLIWDSTKRAPVFGFGPGPQWSGDGRSLVLPVEPRQPQKNSPIADACEVWTVPVEGGEPARLASVPGPSPFLSIQPASGAMALFLAPKTPMEEEPTLALLAPPYDRPRTLAKITAALMGMKPGDNEVETIPVPALSPDGAAVALAAVPKTGPAHLLLFPAAGGAPQRVAIPVPSAAPAPAAAAGAPKRAPAGKAPAKKPAVRKKKK